MPYDTPSYTVKPQTLGEALDRFCNRPSSKSPHTLASYRYVFKRFFEFLDDDPGKYPLPIQVYPSRAEDIPLDAFQKDDAPIMAVFLQWLLSKDYKPRTIHQRIIVVRAFFQYLADYEWLPRDFPLQKAKRIVKAELGKEPKSRALKPNPYMGELITYYENAVLPPALQHPGISDTRIMRWNLTQLRNNTLLHCLAETGGRISELLTLRVDQFPSRFLQDGEVIRIQVRGKGGYEYDLRFVDSLPVVRRYIKARAVLDYPALFIAHNPPFVGKQISRVTAWRVVAGASAALGIGKVSPHDFRHWRATQMVNAGVALDVVQEYLGHQWIETTKQYYAHTELARVDQAALDVRIK